MDDDLSALRTCNDQFIEACRQGSWELLQPVLAPGFRYLDGLTGEVWDEDRYIKDLRANPAPTLSIDEVVVHVVGDTATVSARTHNRERPGRRNRYLDIYARRAGGWACVQACVWPLPDALG